MEVVIFGAGLVGHDCLRRLAAAGVGVAAFLDNHKPAGAALQGRPIYRPEEAPASLDRDLPVIIGVWRADVDIQEVRGQLAKAGWTDVCTMAAFIRRHHAELGDIYWRADPGLYLRPENAAAIDQVRGIWADEASLSAYERLLRLRRDFDDTGPSAVDPDEYLPKGVPGLFREPVRYVDAGAYDGGVLFQILASGRKVEAAALFEPGMDNFKLMVSAFGGRDLGFPCLLWPCALGEDDESVLFQQDGEVGMASRKSSEGGTRVPSVRLDSVLAGFRPNLIKLDVEGFELSVLKGAANTIKNDQPNLAVCLYHKAEDLWEIPKWLVDNFPDARYKHYLRQHGQGLDSHCLYAISDDKRR